jgi:sulfinoalanine decarboxylase
MDVRVSAPKPVDRASIMENLLPKIFEIAQELLAEEAESPPVGRVTVPEMQQLLDIRLGQKGIPALEVMERMRQVGQLTPKTSSSRFFNQLFAGRQPMASAAEMLTGMWNVSMYTYKVAGPMILIENEVLERMCQTAGFPDGFGIVVPGGSMANLVGMVLGRHKAMPNMRNEGSDGRRLTYYVSELGHYSTVKNAGILGTGRNNVRRIPVDEFGRMRTAALRAALVTDLAEGHVPCAIIATMGTTVLGEFDPLREISAVAREFDVWLHADGAYGGTMLLHPEARKHLDGLELADSLTWNAHKAMGIPLTCSALLTRERHAVRDILNEDAEYLYQADDDLLNPGTRSLQCGRRNDTFKLWAAWLNLGDEGWAKYIERQLHLARYAAARVKSEPSMELCQEPASTNICFSVQDLDADEACTELHESGHALIGYGNVRGQEVFRLVTVNPEIQESDLDRLFDAILEQRTRAAALRPLS